MNSWRASWASFLSSYRREEPFFIRRARARSWGPVSRGTLWISLRYSSTLSSGRAGISDGPRGYRKEISVTLRSVSKDATESTQERERGDRVVPHGGGWTHEVLEVSRQGNPHRIKRPHIKPGFPAVKIMTPQPFCNVGGELFRQSQFPMADHFSTEEPGGSPGPNAGTEVVAANVEVLGVARLQRTPRGKSSWNLLIVAGIPPRP